MKVFSLLFLGFLGTAVAEENGLCIVLEYRATEYSEEYTPYADGIGPGYEELESYADEEFVPTTASGWFMPGVNGSFYWMSKDELNKERQAFEDRDCPVTDTDSMEYLLYSYNGEISYEILRSFDKRAVQNSKFNVSLENLFLIDGFNSNCDSDFIKEATKELFAQKYNGVQNIFCVDWSAYNGGPYYFAAIQVEEAGKYVARFIDFLNSERGTTFSNLVGHGLGAHVASYAGKNVKSQPIDSIIGLDPSSAGFDYENCSQRLCNNDAIYVQSIQTSGGPLFPHGFDKPLACQTFYPDGGIYQTPCYGSALIECSHQMAWKYYVSALKNDIFCSIKCNDYKAAQNMDCSFSNSRNNMFFPKTYTQAGYYYAPIDSDYPYGGCNRFEKPT